MLKTIYMRKIALVFGLLLVSYWSTTAQEEYESFTIDPDFYRAFVSGIYQLERITLTHTDYPADSLIEIQQTSHEMALGCAVPLCNTMTYYYSERVLINADPRGLHVDMLNIFFTHDGVVYIKYNKRSRKWHIGFNYQTFAEKYITSVPTRVFVAKNPEEEFRKITRDHL